MSDTDKNKPLSRDEEAMFDTLLGDFMKREEEGFERPSDEAIHAYLSDSATAIQKVQVQDGLESSDVFCRELLVIAEDLDRVKSAESPRKFEPQPGKKESFFQRMSHALGNLSRGHRTEPLAVPKTMIATAFGSAEGLGTMVALREENAKLKRAVRELTILNELGREIAAARDVSTIMDRIAYFALRSVGAEQVVITQTGEWSLATVARAHSGSPRQTQPDLDQNLLGWMYINKHTVLLNDPSTDEQFKGLKWDSWIRSILCAPIMVGAELHGVLTAFNKKDDKGFSDDDERVLSAIAMQCAHVFSRPEAVQKVASRIQDPLDLGSVSQELLPKEVPTVSGYDIYARNIPAEHVGGAYYDFIPIEDNRLGICLGDVPGEGVTASLSMAGLQATLRGQTLKKVDASQTISRSNRLLCRSTKDSNPKNFATLFFGVLDPKNHSFSFSNAGHQNPMLFSGHSNPKRLETGGLVLGVVDDFQFEEETVRLRPGDTLVAFSDGIPEAFDEAENQFGEKRLAEVIELNKHKKAKAVADSIIEAVKDYAGDAPQSDDLTVVVVRREKEAQAA